jgi:hypothetical protein
MLSLVVGVVLAAPAWATEQEASSTSAPDLRSVAGGVLRWSLSPLVQAKSIPSPEDDDDVGGFFDQYEFTPNKGSDVPLEIGIREGALDFFSETETPIFQLRFASPSSNLGLTGSAGEDPFFDQRLAALARVDGLDVDLRYGRTRTEQLRLFPNTAGARLVFNDFSSPKDRFYRDRTGVSGEVRLRPHELAALGSTAEWLAPELSLRGGYEERDGEAQRRFLRNPSNTWLGASQDLERDVADVGGGLLVAPGGLFTLALDFDYERFRFDSDPLTEADFGFAPPAGERPVSFTPSSDRYTGTARFNSRVGDRVQLEGGFQISQLEQAGDRTPEQRRADLDDVEVRTTSANAAIGWRLSRSLSLRGFFKFDQRDNDISRSTSLFNPDDQIVPFVEDWDRILAGAELEMRLARDTRVVPGERADRRGHRDRHDLRPHLAKPAARPQPEGRARLPRSLRDRLRRGPRRQPVRRAPGHPGGALEAAPRALGVRQGQHGRERRLRHGVGAGRHPAGPRGGALLRPLERPPTTAGTSAGASRRATHPSSR